MYQSNVPNHRLSISEAIKRVVQLFHALGDSLPLPFRHRVSDLSKGGHKAVLAQPEQNIVAIFSCSVINVTPFAVDSPQQYFVLQHWFDFTLGFDQIFECNSWANRLLQSSAPPLQRECNDLAHLT